MTLETVFYLGFSKLCNLLIYADSEFGVFFQSVGNLNDISTEDTEII